MLKRKTASKSTQAQKKTKFYKFDLTHDLFELQLTKYTAILLQYDKYCKNVKILTSADCC